MATSKAIRADDASGLNIATIQATEDAVTKDWQRVVLNDPTTPANMATVSGGALKVDGSGVTQPASIAGTVNVKPTDGTNAISKTFDLDSSGTTHEWNVGVGLRKKASGGSVELGTSSDPIRTDPTGTTVQPVSAASLPLPTGAATAAKQPALGTAGSASADVISIQGIASMTAVKVDGSGVTQPVSAASLPLPSGAATAAKQPALGTAGTASTDVITIQGIASMTKLLVTPDSVALPAHQSTNVDQWAGTAVDVNSGNKSAGTIRVVIATDQPALTNALKVDPSGVTSPVSLASLPSLAAGSALIGTVQPVAGTTGGMSFFTQSLTSTKAQVKGSAGTVYGISAVNNGSTLCYVQVFNKASASVTVGTTAPDYVVAVPAPSSGTAGAGIREEYALGLAFGTGITVACTTTRTGSTSATCDVNVNYA